MSGLLTEIQSILEQSLFLKGLKNFEVFVYRNFCLFFIFCFGIGCSCRNDLSLIFDLLYERDIFMCINLGEIEKLEYYYYSCINLFFLMYFDQK